MKRVTGIEAIQSGKPFRHVSKSFKSIWIDHCGTGMGSLSPADLLMREFEIKPEPREFWVKIDASGNPCTVILTEHYTNPIDWIKVREVLE